MDLPGCPLIVSAAAISARAQSPRVTDLASEIEYEQGRNDPEFLNFIPVAFPNPETLTMFRYRMLDAPDINVVSHFSLAATRALRALSIILNRIPATQEELRKVLAPLAPRLRVLRLFLDYAKPPGPLRRLGDGGGMQRTREHNVLYRTCQAHADILSRTLSPSREVVCFLRRPASEHVWLPYRVAIGAGGERNALCEGSALDGWHTRFIYLRHGRGVKIDNDWLTQYRRGRRV